MILTRQATRNSAIWVADRLMQGDDMVVVAAVVSAVSEADDYIRKASTVAYKTIAGVGLMVSGVKCRRLITREGDFLHITWTACRIRT